MIKIIFNNVLYLWPTGLYLHYLRNRNRVSIHPLIQRIKSIKIIFGNLLSNIFLLTQTLSKNHFGNIYFAIVLA
jgi:hypothetical protein